MNNKSSSLNVIKAITEEVGLRKLAEVVVLLDNLEESSKITQKSN